MKLIKTVHCRSVQALDAARRALRKGPKQRLQEGPEALLTAPILLKDSKAQKPMILAQRSDFPGREALLAALEEAGMDYVIWDDVSENPSCNEAENIRLYWLGARCDSFIAVGGPAVLNAAKAAAARAAHPGKNLQKLSGKNKLRRRLPPVLAIPTQILPDSGEGRALVGDLVLEDVCLLPRLVILDPALLEQTDLDAGLWALCRAAEAAIAPLGGKEGEEQALSAFEQLFAALEGAAEGNDPTAELMSGVHKAALAAQACVEGYACALGRAAAEVMSLPMGASALVMLPAVLEAYGKAGEEELAKLADCVNILEEEEAETGAEVPVDAEGQTVAPPPRDLLWRLRNLAFRLELPELYTELNSDSIFLLAQAAEKRANPHGRAPVVWGRKELQKVLEHLCGE